MQVVNGMEFSNRFARSAAEVHVSIFMFAPCINDN